MAAPKSRRRATIEYAVCVLLLLLPAAILNASFKEPDRLSFFDRAILAVTSPLQVGVGWIVSGVGGLWNGYVALVDVEDENQALRRQNAELRQELLQARQQIVDIHHLERLVGLRERVSADTVGARVISATMNAYFRVVRVRLENTAGNAKAGMAVLTPDGLVGRVERSYGPYADVLLAIDPQSAIDVRVSRTGSRGILRGVGAKSQYVGKIDYMSREDALEKGDLVVTSGLGGFPRVVPVGTISEIKRVEYGLYQEVAVTPVVDFSRLSEVLVVLAPAPSEDPDAGRRAPEAAYDLVPYK